MLQVCVIVLLAIIYPTGCKGREVAHTEVFGYLLTYYDYDSDKKTFREAIAACGRNGGYLASVKSSALSDKILEILHSSSKVWIGGTNAFDGTWIWLDGTNLSDGYTKWASSEPNNHDGNEHCLVIRSSCEGKWNDEECHNKRGYVCQIDLRESRKASNSSIGVMSDFEEDGFNERFTSKSEGSCYESWLVALLISGTLLICLLVGFFALKHMYARYKKQQGSDEVSIKEISYKNTSVFAIEVETKNPQSERKVNKKEY